MRVLILLALVAAAFAQDECLEPTKAYFECARDAHDAHITAKREVMQDVFSRLKSECLEANGCDVSGLDFPTDEEEDHFNVITDEQKQCLRKQMWEHKLDEVEECATDAPAFLIDAIRQVSRSEKAKFMHAMGHMKHQIKKTMKKCTKDNKKARKDVYKCMMALKKEKESHKQELCVKNQECVDQAFAENAECLDQIMDNGEQQCKCYQDKIAKPASKFIGMMKRRREWSDEQKARVIERLSPHFEACGLDVQDIIEQLTAPAAEGRYKRHVQRRQADSSSEGEDDSEDASPEGGSHGSHEHGSSESGQHERGNGDRTGPAMCMCHVSRIGESDAGAAEVADDVEGAVASFFF